MLRDARSLPDKSVVDTDVCIVGAGPAGITLARELDGEGFSVCLVESGGLDFDAATQALSELTAEGSDIVPLAQNRRRQFGGNANLWFVGRRPFRSLIRYLPLDQIDFAHRPWVPHSGWPFPKSDLNSYYVRALDVVGLGPRSWSVMDVERPDARPLPLDAEGIRTSVEWFGTSQPFVGEHRVELQRSANVTILIHANVGRLEAVGGRIERVRVDCLSGTSHSIAAKVFVIAAGGIENPRLLLASNGIGNERDLVGRFFMDHLHVRGVLCPFDQGRFETSALYDVRPNAYGRIMGCKLNPTEGVMERERLLNSALKLDAALPSHPLARADTYARLMLRHRQLRPSFFGWSALPGNAQRFSEFATHLQIELPPNPDNRVTLSAERDRFGRPLAAVRWRWDELTRRSVQRTRHFLTDALERAGIGKLEMPEDDPPPFPHKEGTNHHIGTTRMHADPAQGVVDADCRVHGMSNLFVTGSSVFPTGGYANPTLTIVALAIRLAERVRRLVQA